MHLVLRELHIGETKRPIGERLMEHRRAARNRDIENTWGAHYANTHQDKPVPTIPFQARIITGHVNRKLTIKLSKQQKEHPP